MVQTKGALMITLPKPVASGLSEKKGEIEDNVEFF